jgi:hypothetical protein
MTPQSAREQAARLWRLAQMLDHPEARKRLLFYADQLTAQADREQLLLAQVRQQLEHHRPAGKDKDGKK